MWLYSCKLLIGSSKIFFGWWLISKTYLPFFSDTFCNFFHEISNELPKLWLYKIFILFSLYQHIKLSSSSEINYYFCTNKKMHCDSKWGSNLTTSSHQNNTSTLLEMFLCFLKVTIAIFFINDLQKVAFSHHLILLHSYMNKTMI